MVGSRLRNSGRALTASMVVRGSGAPELSLGLLAGGGLLAVAVGALAVLLMPDDPGPSVVYPAAWGGWLASVVLLLAVAAEAFELVEICGARRPIHDASCTKRRQWPLVSLHVPICSEPPEVVERTLQSLRVLRYHRLEVLVIDNNTKDETLWRPVEDLCRQLGHPFHFFHLEHWPGFKAGALNYALVHTSPEATIVGIIDSDYVVRPDFLSDLVAYFERARIGFVQAPQDYREWECAHFARMCYWEYWQFFAVSMLLRRRRNAILMHGTMVLIRRSALDEVGGWTEECLTEDSELGLRLLAAGYSGIYCHRAYGHGLVPFSFRDYSRQRRRWVTGGVQTLQRHWRLFLPWSKRLTAAQKLHYLQGWAPWLRDGVLITLLPVVSMGSVYCLATHRSPDQLFAWSASVLGVLLYLVIRQVSVYRFYLKCSWSDTINAGIAILGLILTVGLAWNYGWFKKRVEFRRTPKFRPKDCGASTGSIEISLALICCVLAILLVFEFGVDALWTTAGEVGFSVLFGSAAVAGMIERCDNRVAR